MSKLEFYCTEFGLYTSDQEASDYGKLPEPSLSEVQEVQSASFLSFREILNYWISLTIFFITFKVSLYRFLIPLYICILLSIICKILLIQLTVFFHVNADVLPRCLVCPVVVAGPSQSSHRSPRASSSPHPPKAIVYRVRWNHQPRMNEANDIAVRARHMIS